MKVKHSALRPILRPRLYESLVARLRAYVQEEGLTLGARFPTERALAASLSVSRASIGQAMVALEVQGLVDIRHGDGIYLKRPMDSGEPLYKLLEKRQRLPEILEAREALECKLAELAARRRSDADLQTMDEALSHMENEIRSHQNGAEGDARFHQAIAVAARSALLAKLIGTMANAMQESREESLNEPSRPRQSLTAHRRILQAIREKDGRRAAGAMRAHLQLVADVQLLRWEPGPADD